MIPADRILALTLAPLADVRAVLGPQLHRLHVLAPHPGAVGIGTLRALRIRIVDDVVARPDAYEVVAGYDRYDEMRSRRGGARP